MKNKLIIIAMFVLVVILTVTTWRLLSAEEVRQSMALLQVEPPQKSNEPAAQHSQEQLPVSEPVTESAPTVTEPTRQPQEPTLCQLVAGYDDWYNNQGQYESKKLMEELRGWADSRGYFELKAGQDGISLKQTSDYDYYELDDLRQMADAGDANANVRYAYRLSFAADEEALAAAQPYCIRAIVDGYSSLNGCIIAGLYQELFELESQEELQPEKIRATQLQIRAWSKVYELQQDPVGAMLHQDFFFDSEVEIPESLVEQQAQVIYQNLEAQRAQKGLGPFQFSEPPPILMYSIQHQFDDKDIAKCLEG